MGHSTITIHTHTHVNTKTLGLSVKYTVPFHAVISEALHHIKSNSNEGLAKAKIQADLSSCQIYSQIFTFHWSEMI